MPQPRVFITRHLPGPALDFLKEKCRLEVWPGELPPPPPELRRQAAISDGILTLLTDAVDRPLFGAASDRLRVVSNMATGYDNIDVKAATEHAVLITRTPGVLSETTADFAFALILVVARRVVEADRYVRHGRWQTWGPETLLGCDVHDATLGIVGMGGIGRQVARRARGFGMRIFYNSRTAKPGLERRYRMQLVDLDRVFAESDIITLHAPLNPETRGMVNQGRLRLMKPSAVLVNTARGPLVDHAALHAALKEGRIAGAALDVTDPEPLPADHPLLRLENVVLTPHIASASIATRSRMAMLAAGQLVEALEGRPPRNVVNPSVIPRWRERMRESGGYGQKSAEMPFISP